MKTQFSSYSIIFACFFFSFLPVVSTTPPWEKYILSPVTRDIQPTKIYKASEDVKVTIGDTGIFPVILQGAKNGYVVFDFSVVQVSNFKAAG